MMAVRLKHDSTEPDFEPATPLCKARMLSNQVGTDDAVTPDGGRFLVGTVVGEAQPSAITIVTNWTEGLTTRGPQGAGQPSTAPR